MYSAIVPMYHVTAAHRVCIVQFNRFAIFRDVFMFIMMCCRYHEWVFTAANNNNNKAKRKKQLFGK